MNSITTHPLFALLVPFYRVEKYDRDGGHKRPRVRLRLSAPPRLKIAALETFAPCVACGKAIHPYRDSVRGVYVAVSCPLDESMGCARTRAASREYLTIQAALKGHFERRQLKLPGLTVPEDRLPCRKREGSR